MDASDWRKILRRRGYAWDPIKPGATEAQLADLTRWFGRPLPEDYTAFLRLNNGATVACKGAWELAVFSTDQVPEAAQGYRFVPPRLVGGILFGTDLSDEGLVFDIRSDRPDGQYPVYSIPWIDISDGWEAAVRVADDLRSLLTLRKPLHSTPQFTRLGLSSYAACIAAPLACPYCGALVSSLAYLKWGYCPEPRAIPSEVYQLGERVKWQRSADGSIRPWAIFDRGGILGTLNLGDPAIENLVTRDVLQFDVDPRAHRRPCSACGRILEGAAAEIREGVIRRAWIYLPGELDNSALDYVIQPDGTLVPKPEWNDHQLEIVRLA